MNLNQPELSSPLVYPTSLQLLAVTVAGYEITIYRLEIGLHDVYVHVYYECK